MGFQLKSVFSKVNVEYFNTIKYDDCHIINVGLSNKLVFKPVSATLFLLPYYVDRVENFSVYAASRDYHLVVKEIGEIILPLLAAEFPENHFEIFGDHSPIDERLAAASAGLGVLGDNGLLINEKYGSYVFIAEIISDVSPELLGLEENKEIGYCEHCGLCRCVCPTAILAGDSGECLSAITQRKGELTASEVEIMKSCNTVWGCDACQKVCPHNKDSKVTPIALFQNDRITSLTTEEIEAMSDVEFSKRAFSWRGKKTVLRNLKLLGY